MRKCMNRKPGVAEEKRVCSVKLPWIKPGKRKIEIKTLLSPTSSSPAVGDEVPDGAEEEPGDGVGHDEDKERAAPVEVNQGGEDVRQVAVGLLHVAVLHVAAPVFLHVALPLAPAPACQGGGEGEGRGEEVLCGQ